MLSKKVKFRIYYLAFSLISISIVIFFILKSLEDNVLYFFSPTEIYNKPSIVNNKNIRLGGVVKLDSIKKMELQSILLLQIFKTKLLFPIMAWFQIYFLKEKEWSLKEN